MADAAPEADLLPGPEGLGDRRLFSLCLGSYAAATSDSYDASVLGSRIRDFRPADDFAMGAALHPLDLQAGISLDRVARGLGLRASFGWLEAARNGYSFQSLSVGGGLEWLCLAPRGSSRPLRWEGLCLSLGIQWARNSVGTRASTGAIDRSFSADPDGDGPLLPMSFSISLDPSFDIAAEAGSLILPLQAATGLSLGGILSLRAGIGLYPAWSSGDVRLASVAGTTAVSVDSYLEGLIQSEGSVQVSGSTDPVKGRPLGAFLSAQAILSLGGCSLVLPLLWDFGSSLGAGLAMRVSI